MRSRLAICLLLAACGGSDNPGVDAGGDGDGDGDGGVDASVDAGAVGDGAIRIFDLLTTTPGANTAGARIDIAYRDLTAPAVTPAFGEDPPAPGGCVVWVIREGVDPAPVGLDEGPVTIGATQSPAGVCRFDSGAYLCEGPTGALPAGSGIAPGANDTATITATNAFAGADLAGAWVELAGFANAPNNGLFPVVVQNGNNEIVVVNASAINETLAADGDFATRFGVGPTLASRAFLDDGSTPITVAKDAGTLTAAIDSSIDASGQGLTLDSGSAQPHMLPGAAEDITFSCGGDGNCGADPGGRGQLVLVGRSTDGDVAGVPAAELPPPVTASTRFECVGDGTAQTLTIPSAAWSAVLGTSPSRIEVQLVRAGVVAASDTSIAVGHGVIGTTDP